MTDILAPQLERQIVPGPTERPPVDEKDPRFSPPESQVTRHPLTDSNGVPHPMKAGVTNVVTISQLSFTAGQVPQITVPAGSVWRLLYCGGDLSTSSAVSVRYPFLHVFKGPFNASGGPDSIGRFLGPHGQGPSELWSHVFGVGLTHVEPIPGLQNSQSAIPDLTLLSGWTVSIEWINNDAADLWTAFQWTLEE